ETNRMFSWRQLTCEIRHDERTLLACRKGKWSTDGPAVDAQNDPARSFRPGVGGVIGNDRPQRKNRRLRRTEPAALVGLDDGLQSLPGLRCIRRITHPGEHRECGRLY